MLRLIVLAKRPEPGRVKTRLTPPCTPEQAAELARAALDDTLDAAAATCVFGQRVLAMDGDPTGIAPPGFRVVAQGSGGLDERIARVYARVGGPALLIGMDTPQVTAHELDQAGRILLQGDVDSVLGPAVDGGFWAVGVTDPTPDPFIGVPMSQATTGREQRRRLVGRGDRIVSLPLRRDVDRIDDAWEVAGIAPWTRFAAALQRLGLARPDDVRRVSA